MGWTWFPPSQKGSQRWQIICTDFTSLHLDRHPDFLLRARAVGNWRPEAELGKSGGTTIEQNHPAARWDQPGCRARTRVMQRCLQESALRLTARESLRWALRLPLARINHSLGVAQGKPYIRRSGTGSRAAARPAPFTEGERESRPVRQTGRTRSGTRSRHPDSSG